MKKKIIGILGGFGPESTAMFYQKIIQQCQEQYGAVYDADYPEMLIYNLPIPNIVDGLESPAETSRILIKGAKKLESFGSEMLAIPCNTAHYFAKDIENKINIPLINIFTETAKKINLEGYKRVGFLSTKTTIKYKSYGDNFEKYGITLILSERQKEITEIIINLLAGKKLKEDKTRLKQIIRELKGKGAEAIVLGCTDFSTFIKQEEIDIKIVDTITILAEAIVQYSIGTTTATLSDPA